ncbi:MAG: tetratricopeptide repeat protein [Bacteroidota bacterium]
MKIKLNNKTLWTIIAYLTTIFFFSFPDTCIGTGSQDRTIVDSLETVLHTAKEDTTRIITLIQLSQEYWYTRPDTAYVIAKDAYSISGKLALSGDEGGTFRKQMADAANSMAASFYFRSDFPNALKHWLNSLKINEELEDKTGIARSLGNIGLVYHRQGEYHQALKYYFKSLKAEKEIEHLSGIAGSLGNIGLAYSDQGDYPKALEYYFKALKINEELDAKRDIAIDLSNIGGLYYYLSNYTKALEYYFKALKLDEESGDKSGIAADLGNIGSLYIQQKKYREAEHYFLQALELSKDIGALNLVKSWHQALSELYEQTGQAAYVAGDKAIAADRYKKAYQHHIEYSIAKDSIFNEEKSKDIGKLEAKHEMEMAETKRKQEEEEQVRILEEQTERRNLLQYSGILIFIVAFIIILLFSGKLNIPVRLAEGGIFFTFLLVFEFLLVLLDPAVEQYTGNEPAYKLIINAGLAALIFPLHSFAETKIKQRLFATKKEIIKKRQKPINT